VGDRVLCPGVGGLQGDCFTAIALGEPIVAAFFQPERVQAEQRMIARQLQ